MGSVPFMSLVQKASFNNHGSLAEEHKINLYAMKWLSSLHLVL